MRKSVISMGMALILVMAFTSCKKTEEGKSENAMFRASTANVTSSDKTFVGQLDGHKFVMWNENDAIKVFTRTASPFSVEASVLTTDENAKPEVLFYGDVRESDVYYAYYPAGKISNLEAGNKIHVTLPETQAYTEGGFAGNTYPMWAFNSEKYFNFHSTCAILGIQLNGNAKVGSIVLSSKSADEPLAGTVEIDAAAFNPSSPSYTFTEKKQSVTLSCGEQGVQLTESANATFYFVIPANSYNGIKVVVNDLQGNKLGEKETSNNLPMAAETIYKMDPFTVNAEEPTPGVEGQFTINSTGGKVVFAPGNLYYLPNATTKWQFAPKQYESLPTAPQMTTSQSADRDLFGWGTSGYDNTANDPLAHHFQPWDILGDWNWSPETNYNVHGYGPTATPQGGTDIGGNGVDVNRNYDWGYYNDIYNPSTKHVDEAGTWRVLTGGAQGEVRYIFETRSTQTNLGVPNARYAKATILGVGASGADVKGLIAFPDVYNHPEGVAVPNNINVGTSSFSGNKYSSADWDKMDLAGAVFLPEGGRYEEKTYAVYMGNVNYWTATHLYYPKDPGTSAYMLYVTDSGADFFDTSWRRSNGMHVRLVKDVTK